MKKSWGVLRQALLEGEWSNHDVNISPVPTGSSDGLVSIQMNKSKQSLFQPVAEAMSELFFSGEWSNHDVNISPVQTGSSDGLV